MRLSLHHQKGTPPPPGLEDGRNLDPRVSPIRLDSPSVLLWGGVTESVSLNHWAVYCGSLACAVTHTVEGNKILEQDLKTGHSPLAGPSPFFHLHRAWLSGWDTVWDLRCCPHPTSPGPLQPTSHLFLIPALQELQATPPVTLVCSQGAAVGLGQARGWRDAAALRVHPGVDVIGDIAPGDAPR